MAREIMVRSGVTIRKSSVALDYSSRPSTFNATLEATSPKGPTPGNILVTTAGTDIDLSELVTMGGICVIQNRDPTNFVTVGIWDGAAFFPIDDILPGEVYVRRLSRYILTSMVGTATTQGLRIVANTASCIVTVEAWDR